MNGHTGGQAGEEARLIELAQGGDSGAFDQLMAAHEKRIYGLCLRMMGGEHDAQDARQEALLRIWQKIGAYRGDAAFSTWACRVTANVCLDLLRRRGRQPHASLEELRESGFDVRDAAPTPEDEAQASETRDQIREAISSVPDGMRDVFILRDVQGRSVEETAQALGISAGTVKSRLSRARMKIAAAMREMDSGVFGRAAACAGALLVLLGLGGLRGVRSAVDLANQAGSAAMMRTAPAPQPGLAEYALPAAAIALGTGLIIVGAVKIGKGRKKSA